MQRKYQTGEYVLPDDLSYNPCFSGSSSATKYDVFKERVKPSVTILVFLAALVQQKDVQKDTVSAFDVTILVFLAALVQLTNKLSNRTVTLSYNPCFSGSSSATNMTEMTPIRKEESYNPCFSGSSSATKNQSCEHQISTVSYNPCFSGSSSATISSPT